MAMGDIIRLPRRFIPDRTTQTAPSDNVRAHASFSECPFLISPAEIFRFITYALERGVN